ncbi:MAG: hypothetical protein K6E91_07070, partial [Butyrivibrio sp.]|nr:hypothetical protein [Butyrivibrio sp.]
MGNLYCIRPFLGEWVYTSGDADLLSNISKEGGRIVTIEMSDKFGDNFSLDEAAADLDVDGKNVY